jgi:transcriptional regulator with XRE-family HTH domain
MAVNSLGEQIARNVREARQAVGLSQTMLAKGASLKSTQISAIERGDKIPQLRTLVRVAGSLGVDASLLLDGIRWQPKVGQERGYFVLAERTAEGGADE